jgi:hypothetical protein
MNRRYDHALKTHRIISSISNQFTINSSGLAARSVIQKFSTTMLLARTDLGGWLATLCAHQHNVVSFLPARLLIYLELLVGANFFKNYKGLILP